MIPAVLLGLILLVPFSTNGQAEATEPEGGMPGISYSTFLASNELDTVNGVASSPDGRVVVAGFTYGANFPVRNAFKPTVDPAHGDAFVAKIDPSASGDASLEFSTFVGGDAGLDEAYAVAVDADGNIYVTGDARSDDFPADTVIRTTGVAGGSDVFVMKLTPDGLPVWATLLGGRDFDYALAIAVDATGSVYITGYTYSDDFPTRNAAFEYISGQYPENAFAAKLTPDGRSLEYSTYIGGMNSDFANHIALGSDGSACILMTSNSTDLPATNTFYPITFPNQWLVAFKLDPTGSHLVWLDVIGNGSSGGIAVDAEGQTTIVGTTRGIAFPVVNSPRPTVEGYDGFVMRLDASGATIVYSVLVGSPGTDDVHGLAIAPSEDVVLIGTTNSPLFPNVNGVLPFHNLPGQPYGVDGFVAILRSDGQVLLFSTFLGGVGTEDLQTVAVDTDRRVFVAGQTITADFPVVNALQPTITNEVFQHGFVTVLTTASSVTPPSLERVVELRQPGKKYRIRVEGENLQPGLAVFIGSDTTPWPSVKLTSKGIVLGSGRAIKSRFPADTAVSIRVVNADGGSSSITFTR